MIDQEEDMFISYCLVCDTTLQNYSWDKVNTFHPLGGTTFFTYGHYGSTFFDPMNDDTLHICICDKCLEEKKDKMKVMISHKKKVVNYNEYE